MNRWWRNVPDWVKIVIGLTVTGGSVGVVILLISGAVILVQGGVA